MNVSEKRNEYTKFLRNSKDLFGMLHGSKRKNVELSNIYGFCVCPGGSNGGIDNRILEVFYGNRPANSYKSIGQNWNISNKIIIEHGALLQYFQLDNGNVLVSLVPARTENIGPVEDEIIIDYIKNIKKLNNIWYLRKHWLFFISYMNQTAIAGNRNILNWIILLYLRNCKDNIVDKRKNDKKVWVFIRNIFTFLLTVGLSGWLIFFISGYRSDEESKKQTMIVEKILAEQSKQTLLLNELSLELKNQTKLLMLIQNDHDKSNIEDLLLSNRRIIIKIESLLHEQIDIFKQNK